MNRRDFLKGIGVGVAAVGAAAIHDEITELPPVPDFSSLDELRPLYEAIEHPERAHPVSAELVRKAVQYAVALPDNPMALLPVMLIFRRVVVPSRDPAFKSACVNSPEFIQFVRKFSKYLA